MLICHIRIYLLDPKGSIIIVVQKHDLKLQYVKCIKSANLGVQPSRIFIEVIIVSA